MDPNEWELEEYEPNDLVGSVIDYVKMEPEVIKDLNESNRSFLGLLLDFRNKPLEILSILNTFEFTRCVIYSLKLSSLEQQSPLPKYQVRNTATRRLKYFVFQTDLGRCIGCSCRLSLPGLLG